MSSSTTSRRPPAGPASRPAWGTCGRWAEAEGRPASRAGCPGGGRSHWTGPTTAGEPGGLGGTYAGPPIACAAALAVLDVIAEEKLMARADAQGARIRGRLGAMIGFDILRARGGEPDGAEAKAVTVRALSKGLILLSCGVYGETIRLLAPLTASDVILDEGLDILEAALERQS
ncbi:MAG: aminotransferase class III-fold pyridoxal phosphate-dependent enzyme [Caulobacter sp.]